MEVTVHPTTDADSGFTLTAQGLWQKALLHAVQVATPNHTSWVDADETQLSVKVGKRVLVEAPD